MRTRSNSLGFVLLGAIATLPLVPRAQRRRAYGGTTNL
jgi:hypothetical protein